MPVPLRRTALEVVRDVVLVLAGLCIVFMTAAGIYTVLTLGHALSQVGTDLTTPTPVESCDPTYFNC